MAEPCRFAGLKGHHFVKLRSQKIKKRILLLLALSLLFVVPYLAAIQGILPVPEPALKVAEIFIVSLLAFLCVSIMQGLTVSRVFMLLEGKVEIEERIFFTKLYSFFLYSIAIAVIFWELGVSASNITIFLGLVTTGLAFAIRDIVTSFFVWFIILTKKPFRIGDTIRLGDDTGTITRIGTFFLTMQTTKKSKEFWKIPNRLILEKPLLNMGKGSVLHSKKIALSKIPPNIDKRMEKIRAIADKYVEDKELIKVLVNHDGDKWYLEFSFTLKTQEEELRSKILTETYSVIKDIVKK
ncbi:MAG: mechanosensitive ion channel domain-containing protein [Candidatus Aenigmatarchaeota archaeon]